MPARAKAVAPADDPKAKSAVFVRCFHGGKVLKSQATEVAEGVYGCDYKYRYDDEKKLRTCLERAQESIQPE